jgi:GDP/UDP-N,N'-diacetylbacillosamine 2-epimerase (hydrolysing)
LKYNLDDKIEKKIIKIAVITGSRAEYGILRPLLAAIQDDPDLALQLVVTGSHLSKDHGMTVTEIEEDGFRIDAKIDISSHFNMQDGGVSSAMGVIMQQYPAIHENLQSDMVVVSGDRYEIFAASAAALVQGVPIAHIHGGELTEGAFDDSFRHAITKMSHLHFTSTGEYRKRVIQMGELPDRVFHVGALALDGIRSLKLLLKEELEKEIRFQFNRHNLLISFHPVTLEQDSEHQFRILLEVLDGLLETNMIFTYANADPGGMAINKMIDEYVSKNTGKAIGIASMGQLKYFSAMQYVDAVVGNSSSGIIEAPSFRIGTINIGNRQKGRVRVASVIDANSTKDDIENALGKLYSDDFQNILKNVVNPYDVKNTARQIVNNIKKVIDELGLKKTFYNVDFQIGSKG